MRKTTWMVGALMVLAGCGVSTGGGTDRDASTDARSDGGAATEAGASDGTNPGADGGTPTVDSGGGAVDGGTVETDGGPGPGVDGGSTTTDSGPGPGTDASTGMDVPVGSDASTGGECRSNRDCGAGFRCATRGCDGPGTCVLAPPVCSAERVCGCDGRTYDGVCAADAAGVRVASTGPCGTATDGGAPDVIDAGSGMDAGGDTRCTTDRECGLGWCSKPLGMCGGTGVCARRPELTACPALFRPVCGCDGRTYGNECEANNAPVNIASNGACPDGGTTTDAGPDAAADVPVSTRCTSNDQCGRAQYCERRTGACDGAGTCVTRPELCTRELAPVCGCDNVTYSNACMAQSAGVSVSYTGECRTTAGCRSNVECGRGQFCEHPAGMCSAVGTCAAMPIDCTRELAPVCGCDDMTYSNQCVARAAGVSVASVGECRTACTPARGCCSQDTDCVGTIGARPIPGAYCVGTASSCTGVCKVRPTVSGQCWRDSDCGAGSTCSGARICPCGAACLLPDAVGTCRASI